MNENIDTVTSELCPQVDAEVIKHDCCGNANVANVFLLIQSKDVVGCSFICRANYASENICVQWF